MTYDERLDEIKSLYKEGAKGDVTAVQAANQLLERLRLDYPDHPLAEAYHGSIMLLIARDKTNPIERLKWAKNGLRLLDKAAAAAPQDSRIRYLRGRSAYRLPEKYFQRTKTVIEDYSFLIDQEVQQEGHLRAMGIDYSKLAYELGEAYRRIGRNEDAARCWTKLEQQTQDPEFSELLRHKLQSLEGKPAIEHIQANESLKSILIGKTARAAGNVLLSWTEEALPKDPKNEEEMQQEAHFKDPKSEDEMKKEARRKSHEEMQQEAHFKDPKSEDEMKKEARRKRHEEKKKEARRKRHEEKKKEARRKRHEEKKKEARRKRHEEKKKEARHKSHKHKRRLIA